MNPGSYEAQNAGCTCSAAVNNKGYGIKIAGKIVFWMVETCPLHGESEIIESIEAA